MNSLKSVQVSLSNWKGFRKFGNDGGMVYFRTGSGHVMMQKELGVEALLSWKNGLLPLLCYS